MNWNKQKLLKNISKIKQFFKSLSRGYKVDKLVHNCKAIKDFNNKFPNLFTLGEINYWYKNFDSLTSKIFYCKVCGKPVKYQNFKYNEYLEYATSCGIFTLISYLTLVIMIGVKLIKRRKNEKYIIMLMPIIGYLVQAVTNISVPMVAPLFWILLGYAVQQIYFDEDN